ncbi:Hypothetical predicted protein [Olea europaea subsp. europaea]|uniref:Pentatricopeptide repeat-containing protein n=1 Tax=Olea europaea subsp. europaea TaxID=158383 RepID=A0A8S0UPD2_OLEEU|nr:Hypothetical predicted protein [Olea europaea subsp. europaea]
MVGGLTFDGLSTFGVHCFESMATLGAEVLNGETRVGLWTAEPIGVGTWGRTERVSVAAACMGMVEEGEKIFSSMGTKYGIQAEMEHYASMVDLYGRAGLLEKAGKLIKSMPFEPDVVVWGALLGACGLHSSPDLAETAANGISKLQQDHPAVYSMLSKIYGENGVWGRVNEPKKLMRKRHARKQKAGSWIESRHVFI